MQGVFVFCGKIMSTRINMNWIHGVVRPIWTRSTTFELCSLSSFNKEIKKWKKNPSTISGQFHQPFIQANFHSICVIYHLDSVVKTNDSSSIAEKRFYFEVKMLTLKWPRYFYSRWCPRGGSMEPSLRKPLNHRNFAMKFAPYMYGT